MKSERTGSSDDGEKSDDEEQDLVDVQLGAGVEEAACVREEGSEHGCDSVGSVPDGDSEGLLGPSVPSCGDDGEEGETGGLEETEEESRGEETLEVGGGGETAGGDTPGDDDDRHQNAVRDLDDEPGREGLPCQLERAEAGGGRMTEVSKITGDSD